MNQRLPIWFFLSGMLMAAGCTPDPPPPAAASGVAAAVADLPVAVSNNAVALVEYGGHFKMYSFLGLLSGKTWRDVTDRAFEYDSRTNAWLELPPVPGGAGRLAGAAQTVANQIHLFGGYTVAADGSEASIAQVHRFDPETRSYHALPPMPVPVDDTVAAAYQDRYVYLVSGWHDIDNVADVQLFDTQTESWLPATPYPGPPVFGHAGGLAGSTLVICDGVRVVPPEADGGRRQFVISAACWRGDIDPVDPTIIDWQPLDPHPGPPIYRAAAAGAGGQEGFPRVLFAGGAGNPYNYNGIGYDGSPSQPGGHVFGYLINERRWRTLAPLPIDSMDHRGLLIRQREGVGFLAGGLGANQHSRSGITKISVKPD